VPGDIFGVAVMMTLLTTAAAPLIMVRLFDGRSGRRRQNRPGADAEKRQSIRLELPNKEVADFLLSTVIRMFEEEECYVHQAAPGEPIYQVRKDDIAIAVKRERATLELSCQERDREFARLILLEALADLVRVFEGLRGFQTGQDDLRAQVI